MPRDDALKARGVQRTGFDKLKQAGLVLGAVSLKRNRGEMFGGEYPLFRGNFNVTRRDVARCSAPPPSSGAGPRRGQSGVALRLPPQSTSGTEPAAPGRRIKRLSRVEMAALRPFARLQRAHPTSLRCVLSRTRRSARRDEFHLLMRSPWLAARLCLSANGSLATVRSVSHVVDHQRIPGLPSAGEEMVDFAGRADSPAAWRVAGLQRRVAAGPVYLFAVLSDWRAERGLVIVAGCKFQPSGHGGRALK